MKHIKHIMGILLFIISSNYKVQCFEEIEIKPDIVKSFPQGFEEGEITYIAGPTEKIGPVEFQIWKDQLYIVNGGRLKFLKFSRDWTLLKEIIPSKKVNTIFDINYLGLFSNGVSLIYFLKEGKSGYYDEYLKSAPIPNDPVEIIEDERISIDNFLANIILGIDSLALNKNHFKSIMLSDGRLILDQDRVIEYLLKGMNERKFIKKYPELSKKIIELNREMDSYITKRFASVKGAGKDEKVLSKLLNEIFVYLQNENLNDFINKTKGDLLLKYVTDYGFIFIIYPPTYQIGVGLKDYMYYKIDLLKNEVTRFKLIYPKEGRIYGPILDEEGNYMYAMVLIVNKEWQLLRFPLN